MHRLQIFVTLCALAALAGCSAENSDTLSLANPHSSATASLAGGQSTAAAPTELAPNHLAQRPATQPAAISPEQTNHLPLWPPATEPIGNPAPPIGPPAAAPVTEAPPLFPADPPSFPAATAPASEPPPQFQPALPAIDPPAIAAAPIDAASDDANPLRSFEPAAPPAMAQPAPSLPMIVGVPNDNPLRLNSPTDSAEFAPPAAPVFAPPDQLLPPAPAEQAAPPPLAPAAPELPLAPAESAPEATASEAPSQLADLPKPFPRIVVKPAPGSLPRVPVSPQAHAEWSAKQKLEAAAASPSGGSASAADYDPAAYGPPSPPPPATAEAAPASEPPLPAEIAAPAEAPTFEPPAFNPPAAESTPPPEAVEDSVPIIPVPEIPPAAAAAPPPASDVPNFSPPSFAAPAQPAAQVPSAEPAAVEPAPAEPVAESAPVPTATSALVPSTNPNDPFDVVRVFYGTDRMPELVNRDSLLMRVIRFVPAAVLLGLAAVGVGVVLVSRKPTWIIGTAALLVCSALAIWHGVAETIEIANLAAQEEPRYSAEKSDRGRVDRGICEVSIPKSHKPGEMESPTITRLEFEADPRKHITLRKTVRLQNDAFYEKLREQVASSPDHELLVFVHGFNVSFEDAARRTAQMAHDLKLQGAPVFFSWPADKYFLLTYGKDETSVSWSAPHLKEFLLDLVHNTDARAINLVAHSMGNRALTTALREIDMQLRNEARLFNQVVLAAPDIDADDFRDNIAPAVQRTAKQVTLYASSNDIALGASRLLHRNARAGDTSRGLVLVPGMVTIDVSNIDGGPWGHSYYGASDPVLRDLHLLLTSLPPERRTWLNQKDFEGQPYWAFKPLGSSASVPALTTPR